VCVCACACARVCVVVCLVLRSLYLACVCRRKGSTDNWDEEEETTRDREGDMKSKTKRE